MKLWNVICKLQYYTYIQQKCGQKPKAKWNQSHKKQQKPKAKSQESSEAKAKSQKPNGHANWLQTAANSTQIRDFGSKMQQIQARSQKPKEPEAKSQKGMQIVSKLQQIARKSEILAPKCSKYKPKARNRRSQKPKAQSQKPKKKKQKKTCQKNTSPQYFVQIHICKSKKSRSSISRQSAQYLFPSLAPKKLKIPQFSAIFIGKTINRN